MPLERDTLLEHYRQSHAELMAALDGLSEDQLVEPLIDGWSVKDHILHVAFWDDLRADEIGRISAGQESAMRMDSEQDDRLNQLGYELRRGLSLEQARWELGHSHQRLLEAIVEAPDAALDPGRYGEAGLQSHHGFEHAGYIRDWRRRSGA